MKYFRTVSLWSAKTEDDLEVVKLSCDLSLDGGGGFQVQWLSLRPTEKTFILFTASADLQDEVRDYFSIMTF